MKNIDDFLELKIKLLKAKINGVKLKHFDREDAINTINQMIRLINVMDATGNNTGTTGSKT